ncbi:amino acid permease [Candidatus Micrarchaeota archaeon]|nr:amino acid permease [Candidatus Micrarchaeota archaeon]
MAKLKRELGLLSTTIFGIAVIVGAGIYSLIGVATAMAGPGVWLSFIIAALVAALTALSFAELSSMFTGAGSSYLYVFKGMRSRLFGFITGWLILFETVVGVAAISMAFGGYFASLIPIPIMAAALGIILLLSIVNLIGIKESASLNNILFVMELGGLIFIIIAGLLFGQANPNFFDFQIVPVLSGAALVFFAMLGFEMIASESEEAKDASHTIPYAILLSIGICAVLYAMFAVASLMLVGPEILGVSTAPVKDIVFPILGEYSFIFSIIALASTASTILICLITASRLSYGMAKEKTLPHFLSAVNSKFRTPHLAVIAALLVSIAFLLIADMVIIAEVTNFAALAAFFFINISAIMLRIREPGAKRHFRMPFAIANIPVPAVLGAITSLFLIAFLSKEAMMYGSGLVVLGAAVHLLMPKK